MADGGGGKIRAKVSSKSRKPYSRPQRQSLFSRITSSVKNLLDPIAPDWLSKKSDGSPVDKKESNHGQLQRAAAASETSTSSVFQEFTTSGNTTNSNFVNCTDPTVVTSATVSDVPLADGGKDSNKESEPGNATLVQLWSSKSFMSSQQSTMADDKQPQFKPSLLSSPRKRSAVKDANESAFYTGKVQYGGALNVSRTVSYSSPYTIPRATKVQVRSANDSRLSGVQNSSMKATASTNNMSSTARKILQTLEKMSTPLSDAKKIPTYMQSPMYMASRRRNAGASLLSTKQSSNKMPPVDSRVRLTPVSLHKSAKIPLDNSLMTHSLLKSAGAGEQSLPSVTDTPKSSHSHHESSDRVQLAQPSVAQHTGGKMKSQRRTAHYSARHEAEAEPEPLKLPDVALQLTKPLPSFNFGRPGSTSTPAVAKPRPSQEKIAPSGPQSRAVDSPSFNFASPSSKSLHPSTTPATAAKNPEYQFRPPIETVAEKTTATAKQVNFNFAAAATSIKHNALPKKSDSSPIAKATQSVQIGGSVMDILGAKPSESKSGTESSPLLSVAQAKQRSGSLAPLQQVIRLQSDKWECRVCMVKNREDLDNCAACQAPKPGASRSLPPLSKLVDSKASKWECEVCMVKNDESKAACVACQSPKPGSEKNNKPAENSVSASDRPNSGPKFNFGVAQPVKNTTENNPFISQMTKSAKKQWECPTCMIKNDDAKDKCVCCETARPGHVPKNGQSAAQSQSAPAKTFASSLLTQSKAGKWECATCLVRNNADQLKCVSCGDVKRGSASSGSQQPASTATFGTSGVTFSFGTGSAQPLASNTKSGKWECSVCLVKNNPDMNKCAACGENKPGTSSTETKQAASSFKFGTGSTTSALFTFGTGSAKPATDDAKAGLHGKSDAASEGKSVKTAVSSENSFSIKSSSAATGFQLPVSNQTAAKWDCDVCLVRNAPDLTKCCACQSPKPGSSLAQDPPKQTTFRFGNTSAPLFSFGTSQKSATDVTAASNPVPPAQLSAPSFTSVKLSKTTGSGFSFGTAGATATSLAAASDKAKASPANLLPLAAKSNEKLLFGTKLPSSAAASDQQLTPVSAASSASKTEGVSLFSTNQDWTISSSVTTTAPPPYDPFATKPKASVSLFGQFSGGADKPKSNSSATTSGFTGFPFKAQAKTDSEPSDKLTTVPKQATSLPAGFGPNTEKPSIAGSKSAFSFGASAPIKSKTDDTASAASDSNAALKQNPFGVTLTASQTSSTSKPASFQFGSSASTSNQSLASFSSSASSQSTASQIPSFGAAGGSTLPSLFGGGAPKSDDPPKQNTFGMANASNPPSLSQSAQAFPFAQKSTSDQTSLPKPFAFEGAKKSSSTGGPVAGTGFSFGQSATASAPTGFSFGSGNAQGSASTFQSASGFRFGAPGNPTPSDKPPASFNFGGAPQSSSGGFRFGGSAATAPSIFNAGASNVSKPNDGGSMFSIGVGDPNQPNRSTTPQQRPVKRAVRRYKNTR